MNQSFFKSLMIVPLLLCFTIHLSFAQDTFIENQEAYNNDPVPTCLSITNLQHISSSSSSLGFKWQHYSSIYTLDYSYELLDGATVVKSGKVSNPTNCASATSCWASYTAIGLASNKNYTFRVIRNCSPTESSLPTVINAITSTATANNDCDTKSIFATTSMNKINISIICSGGGSNSGPLSYVVTLLKSGIIIETKAVQVDFSGAVSFSNVQSCTDYVVQVSKVVTPICSNTWNQTLAISTPCCGQLSQVAVKNETTNSFNVTWVNPINYPTDGFNVKIKDLQNNVLKGINIPYSAGLLNNSFPNLLNFNLFINPANFSSIAPNTEYIVEISPYCSCNPDPSAPNQSCFSPGVTTTAVNNYPCAAPTSLTVTNTTDNSIAISFVPPVSSLNNQLKKKFFLEIFEENSTQSYASEWIGPNGFNGNTIYHQFNGLKENTNYKIKIKTYCCLAIDPTTQQCIWTLNDLVAEVVKKTLFEPCKSPQGVTISSLTHNAITIKWTNPLTSDDRVKIELIQNSTVIQIQSINTTEPNLSYTFTGLNPTTDYIIRLTSECCQNTYNNGCASYLTGGIVTLPTKTLTEPTAECAQSPVTFNFVPMGNKLKIEWTPSNISLSSTGKRFIFVGLNGLVVIDNPANNIVSGFSQGVSYSLKIRQVFDGTHDTYTKACDWYVKEVAFDPLCNTDVNITVKCLGIKGLMFNLDKPLPNGMKLKAKYRDVTEKLLQSANVDVNDFCNKATFSNIPINSSVSQNTGNNWVSQIITPNPQDKYILSGLKDCSFYEIQIIVEQDGNVCKVISLPNYYHTLGSAGIGAPIGADVNQNGIDDDCEEFVPPPVNTSNPNNLVKLICGQDPPATPETGTPYDNGKIGDTFIVNGFPFEITEISKDDKTQNVYSGKGVMSVPMADQDLLVEFKSITVLLISGLTKKITSGIVKSQKDPSNAVDLVKTINQINSNNNDPNAKFCGDSQDNSKLDELGFNTKGKFGKTPPYEPYSDGDPFDSNFTPSGFDKNGNFMGDVNNQYDNCGCDVKGQAKPGTGKPCTPNCNPPYYWVGANSETEEGRKLYALKKDKLKDDILKILNTREANNVASLTNKKAECKIQRDIMKNAVVKLKYNEALVFGPNKEWITAGMSKYFDKAPLPFKTKMTRDVNHDALEAAHIQLYYCDVEETKCDKIDKIIKKLKDNAVLDMYLTTIGFQIKTIENDQAKKLITEHNAGNPNNFIVWLAERIDKKIEYDVKYAKIVEATTDYKKYDLLPASEYRDWENHPEGVAMVETPIVKKTKFSLADIGQMAAKDENIMNLLKIYHEQPEKLVASVEENLRFEYEQGYNMIGGISRAYILEAVHQKRLMMFAAGNAVGTPLSRSKDGVAKTQNVYFDNIQFTPTGSTVDIYVIIDFKGFQQVFQVLKAPLSAAGFKTPIKLALGSDFSFSISNVARFTLKGQPNPALAGNGAPTTAIAPSPGPQAPTSGENGTYVVIGCDGFGGLNLDAKIEFCRKYFVPLDSKGIELADPAKVEATFKVKVLAFDNVVIDKLSVSPFALARNKDFQFSLKDVVLDFSDTETPTTVKFPGNYITAFADKVPNGNTASFNPTPTWKGFYIGEIKVKLPQKWSKEGEPAKEVVANNFIIDEGGISGECGVNNLLTNGNMAGWKFTIDKFRLDVFHNKLIGAGMEGKIHLPILKEGENFEYTAAMLPGNAYQFTVKPPKQGLAVDLWVADVVFSEGTVVDIEYVNDKYKASAVLYGDINVNSGEIIKMEDFTFQNVVISTDEAVRNPGTWGIPKIGAHVKGFSLTIANIKLTKEEGNGITITKLNVTAAVTLAESETQKLLLNASGNFDILGEITKNTANEQVWKYKDIQLNSFAIKMESNSFKLDGNLTFYRNDKTYGEGFYGAILLNLTKPATTIAVAAVFGKVKNSNNKLYKYFFVDAFVKLPTAIPLGPIGLSGIGGGISWHMEKQDLNSLDLDKAPDATVVNGVPKLPDMPAPKSLTGATYYPNDQIGVGIKFMTTFQLSETPRAFNGGAALEIVFDTDGSLNKIELNGVAHFMAEPTKLPEFTLDPKNIKEGIHAGLALKYDFNKDVFTANMVAYIDIKGKIVGCGSAGTTNEARCAERKLGDIDMYFNIPQKQWYIKIGRTDSEGNNRIGVGFGKEDLGYFVATAYFNIGNYDIKPMPPLPKYAQELVAAANVNFSSDSQMRSSGKAFAFGAALDFSFGLDAFVYATLKVNLGFDFMMSYRQGVICSNYNNSPIGINHWYAEGQIYAQIIGNVGIKVKSKSFSLGNVTASAAMKGGGPNPFWAVGGAKVKYSVLFNLIKGEADVKVSFGHKCDMVTIVNPNGSPDPDAQIIEKITPDKGTDKVSVMAKPTISFLAPIGVTKYSPEDGAYIKAVVKNMQLFDGQKKVYHTLTISYDYMTYTLKPAKMLPGNKKLTLVVEASVYETNKNGDIIEELFKDNRTIEFTTEKLTTIPEENIETSYPINGMFNYYRKEDVANKGFIYLREDQKELFDEIPDNFHQEIQFFSEGKLVADVPFTYNNQKLSFDMPNNKLNPEKIYKMNIVFAPDDEVDGTIVEPQLLLTQYFRVSKYNSLYDKLNQVAMSANNGSINLSAIDEPFDNFELGSQNKLGLLSLGYSDGTWTSTVQAIFDKYDGEKILVFSDDKGYKKTVTVNVKYETKNCIGLLTNINTNNQKIISKKDYEAATPFLPTSCQYRFWFSPLPDLLGLITSNINTYRSVLEVKKLCDAAYDPDSSCPESVRNALKSSITEYTKDPGVILPPAPTKHTFYFNYTLPKDNVPTSKVEKVWNH